MPKLPKWLANSVEALLPSQFHPVTVTEVEYLTEDLKRIRFEGNLQKTAFVPGQVIEFRVTDTEFRHYTPSFYDRGAGVCEVLFHLHGRGPGSEWAKRLRVGDRCKLMGPGGRMKFRKEATGHFVFGDETSLGLASHLYRAAWAYGQPFSCLLELADGHEDWPELIELPATALPENDSNIPWLLKRMDWAAAPSDPGFAYYLTGRAAGIKNLVRILRERGVMNSQIQTSPYWAEGKRGL
ncbi:MAG: siderophore-interacting protein [Bacteroidota bacterium]